jgi:hypothetical protein
MPAKLGSTSVSKIYFGASEITKAYLGTTLVYSGIATDPSFSKVRLLLHADGTNNSRSLIDSSGFGATMEMLGNAVISTSQAKFGTASISCTGGGSDYVSLTSPVSIGTAQDFTIECWVRPLSTTDCGLVGDFDSAGNQQILAILSGQFYSYIDGSSIQGGSVSTNTWHHFAVTRSGGTVRGFLNGTQIGTNQTGNTSAIHIGRVGKCKFRGNYNGYIDDVRITVGEARYTSNFTAPTAAFPEATLTVTSVPVGSITYSQSSQYSGVGAATNALMTNGSELDSVTATNGGSSEYIQIDLGAAYDLGSVVVGSASSNIPGGWSPTHTSTRDIQYSTDGSSWTTLFSLPTYSSIADIYRHAVNINARYLRLAKNSFVAASEFYALANGQTYSLSNDPYFSFVRLLAHFNGTNGSTTFTDNSNSARTLAASGNAQLSTARSKYGSASLLLDGTGDYLTISSSIVINASQDFTIEGWSYIPTSATGNQCIVGTSANTAVLRADSSFSRFYSVLVGDFTPQNTLVRDQWQHWCVQRKGTNTLTIFINGVNQYQAVATAGFTIDKIGYDGTNDMDGNLDDIRVTVGKGRYSTAGFTIPSAAYPDS